MTDGSLLDRRDGVAVWRRIADVLREEILRGDHRAGGLLPGETALAGRFGVNRHTVRQAIRTLAEEGLVTPEQGRGTVVRGGRLSYPIGARTRFSEIVSGQARSPSGIVTRVVEVAAEPRLAARLGLAPGAPLVEFDTLRAADGVPICLATHWLPLPRFAAAAGVVVRTGSMTEALLACGVSDYVRTETRIGAAAASPEDAAALAIRIGASVVVTNSVNADLAGVPVQATRARFAAERVELVVE